VHAVGALSTVNASAGARSRSASEGSEEWAMWLIHGGDVRRLACSFTAMVVQASRFAPMAGELQQKFKVMTAGPSNDGMNTTDQESSHGLSKSQSNGQVLDAACVDLICGELCGGRMNVAIDKSSTVMSSLLELYCVVAPSTLLPVRSAGSHCDVKKGALGACVGDGDYGSTVALQDAFYGLAESLEVSFPD
jgi:hypothetical protein